MEREGDIIPSQRLIAQSQSAAMQQAGQGREGSHHGMDDYMEMKYICLSI